MHSQTTIDPKVQAFIDKLRLAHEVYSKASKRIHNQPMRDQLETLSQKKRTYYQEIIDQYDVEDENNYTLKIKDRIKAELEKAGIEINHVMIRRNEREVLSFCVQREYELIEVYQQLLERNIFSDYLHAILSTQMKETKKLIEELEATREAYNFK
ncbi:MAG TPA: hypothetical protein ACFCUD_12400 [Cyclobacteriaceae bacterium]